MIDAIVFDVGGVLCTSPAALMAARAIEAGVELRTFAGIAIGPFDTDTDHPWHRAERGEISFDETVAGLRTLATEAGFPHFPSLPSAEEVVASLQPIEVMVDLARSARANGIKVGVLTNNIAAWGQWRDIVPLPDFADVVIDSCEVGMRKPDPRIYAMTLDRLGVVPERSLFLDDFPWNVAGAQAVGMHGIHVTDPDAAVAQARVLLGWNVL